jgi:rare lipoprotein A (peptidoglycan hydrolase)
MRSIITLIAVLATLFITGVSMGPLVPAGMPIDTVPVKLGQDTLPIDTVKGAREADTLLNTQDSSFLSDSFSVAGKIVRGTASFYSAKFEGRRTATGERFKNAGLTAASNHFKLNTYVRVTNLKNNRSVIVRVNDRMHKSMKKKGRVVDLTRKAASTLGFIKNGVARVKVEPVVLFAKKSMGITSE